MVKFVNEFILFAFFLVLIGAVCHCTPVRPIRRSIIPDDGVLSPILSEVSDIDGYVKIK